jgi:hypothetical protein
LKCVSTTEPTGDSDIINMYIEVETDGPTAYALLLMGGVHRIGLAQDRGN